MMLKKLTLALFLSVFLFSCSKKSNPAPEKPTGPIIPADARWQQADNLTMVNTISAFSFTIDNKGYFLNEENEAGKTVNLWVYDLATGQWTKKAPFPGASKMGFNGFVVNGKVYVGTGSGSAVANTPSVGNKAMFEYDPATDKWTQKADFPGGERANTVAFSINGVGYMGLGVDILLTKKYSDMWKYDAAGDTWTKIADYPGDGQYLNKGFAAGNKGYVGMGISIADKTTVKKDIWQYDPANNSWTKKLDFIGVARVFGVNFNINGTYYMGLGSGRNELLKDVWKYNETNDTWLQVTNYPDEMAYGIIGFAIGDAAYVGGGASYNPTAPGNLTHFWRFKP
ncbi:Kelch repeat-containing protein [Mucilaginibacter lutimaris]|uniref:Kelch repeat-containing protein n=1 Tax=Mucilaginibacter lutimaris TaxID=931629 RepID=A0ABW2ZCJ4_9SPHI